MDLPLTPGTPGDHARVAAVSYLAAIHAAATDPEHLETLYQTARAAHRAEQFAADITSAYQAAPENLLFAAWYFRLRHDRAGAMRAYLSANWRLAVPLSLALALIVWLLSDSRWMLTRDVPVLAVVWSPLAALALIAFLVGTSQRDIRRALLVAGGLLAATAYTIYAIVAAPSVVLDEFHPGQGISLPFVPILLLHLPLLSAAAVGLTLLGARSSDESRFAFLTKSLETIGTAGVVSIVGGIFVGLTIGIFEALSITIPDVLLRLLIVGGAGLIPVLVVASVYDPTLAPAEQDFRRGLGRLLTLLLRALLPLALVVLVIYLAVIPFNAAQPFTNRDVLIVYNVLLFAILGLLVGVTPIRADDVPDRFQRWLRLGIVALAVLVVLISLYALSAIIYRTAQGALTLNRFVVLGWNVLNIALLVLVLVRQARARAGDWVGALHTALGVGMALYLAWGAFLVLALPWLFR
jgi:hypothetical protein